MCISVSAPSYLFLLIFDLDKCARVCVVGDAKCPLPAPPLNCPQTNVTFYSNGHRSIHKIEDFGN